MRDRELRLPPRCHTFHPVGDSVNFPQQARAFAQQLGSGFRWPGLARAAVKQQHVQRVFNLAHAVGEGAWYQAQASGGAGKTAGLGNGLQHCQGVWRQNIAGSLH